MERLQSSRARLAGETMGSETRSEAPRSSRWRGAFIETLPARPSSMRPAEQIAHFVDLVLDVDVRLDAHAMDLKEIAAAVRRDPALTQGLIRFSPLLADTPRLAPASLEEVAVLLGRERFRLALVSSALLDQRGRLFSVPPRGSVLRHSLMSAFACERLARWSAFHDLELAYLGGLLHRMASLVPAANTEKLARGRLRERRAAQSSPEWQSAPPACGTENPGALEPGGHGLASLLEKQFRRRSAPAELLLEHLVAAACAIARARAAVEAAALPISPTVIQDMIGDALAPYFPRVEARERLRLSLELQVALEPLAAYFDASDLWPDPQRTGLELLPAVEGDS